MAAPPPKGTGVQNIRECIIESKMTFDVSADEWQVYLKNKIMNNIERYVMSIMIVIGLHDNYNKKMTKAVIAENIRLILLQILLFDCVCNVRS